MQVGSHKTATCPDRSCLVLNVQAFMKSGFRAKPRQRTRDHDPQTISAPMKDGSRRNRYIADGRAALPIVTVPQ